MKSTATPWSFDATQYLAPYRAKRVRRPVSLELTENTYPPGELAEASWIPIGLRALSRMASRLEVRDLLIVGTGNGLDALGALEIFDLHSLSVTDVSEESLAVARKNIAAHLLEPARGVELHSYAGDLLTCVPPERRFCLIYENLPNLPLPEDVALMEGINSSSFFDASRRRVPEKFANHLLSLHYLCLQQAHGRLRGRGGVLTSIGGRVPLEVVFDLHRVCGYEPELVVFDVKIQSEPETVVPQYLAAEERHGLTFRYYAPEALAPVARAKKAGLEGAALAAAVKDDLEPLAMTAREAWARCQRGEKVAHSVLMVFGEEREVSRGA